jgi:hypothetical protein
VSPQPAETIQKSKFCVLSKPTAWQVKDRGLERHTLQHLWTAMFDCAVSSGLSLSSSTLRHMQDDQQLPAWGSGCITSKHVKDELGMPPNMLHVCGTNMKFEEAVSSRLPNQEAPVMIAETRKLFCSFLSEEAVWLTCSRYLAPRASWRSSSQQ